MTAEERAEKLWDILYDKMHDGCSKDHLIGVAQAALEAHAAQARREALLFAMDELQQPGATLETVADEISRAYRADKPEAGGGG